MSKKRRVAVSSIRWGGELAGAGELYDGDAPPIIVSDEGEYYDLLDGYHRLGAMIETGETRVTVIIPTQDELELCREFGDGDMDEDEWIELMLEPYV